MPVIQDATPTAWADELLKEDSGPATSVEHDDGVGAA